MAEVHNIVLRYRRLVELTNDEHLFAGSVETIDVGGALLHSAPFLNLRFHQMITSVAQVLRENPKAAVVFQRTERSGLVPMVLNEELRQLLRDDPVAAIRSMDIKLGGAVEHGPVPDSMRSGLDTLADAFGERVYLRMRQGYAEDPLTGSYAQLAYGEVSGWRIRGEGSSYKQWLPIKLEGTVGAIDPHLLADNPAAALEGLSAALHELRWASCSVAELLELPGRRFFLPRTWNSDGQWITRQALRERLDNFRKEREESC